MSSEAPNNSRTPLMCFIRNIISHKWFLLSFSDNRKGEEEETISSVQSCLFVRVPCFEREANAVNATYDQLSPSWLQETEESSSNNSALSSVFPSILFPWLLLIAETLAGDTQVFLPEKKGQWSEMSVTRQLCTIFCQPTGSVLLRSGLEFVMSDFNDLIIFGVKSKIHFVVSLVGPLMNNFWSETPTVVEKRWFNRVLRHFMLHYGVFVASLFSEKWETACVGVEGMTHLKFFDDVTTFFRWEDVFLGSRMLVCVTSSPNRMPLLGCNFGCIDEVFVSEDRFKHHRQVLDLLNFDNLCLTKQH